MKAPRISIIMATRNRARMLDKAIASALAQTVKDWELIIADGASEDDTPAVVKEWIHKEPRIRYIRYEENDGISKNYNRAFEIARGEYIAMMDDDDPWLDPMKLDKQMQFLESHKDYAGCGGGVVVVNPEGKELYRYLKPETDAEIRKRMLFGNPMANSTTMFRKSAGEKAGWYDGSLWYSGDRDFWAKLGLAGKLYNFPEYFSYYTMGAHNTSIIKIRPHLKASLAVMRRYRDKYPGYFPALCVNYAQYAYSFLPQGIRKFIHGSLARLKRKLVG